MSCAALLRTLTSSREPIHAPALAQHIAGCAECQALRLYVLGQLCPGADISADSCAQCEGELAAYVDLTLDEGASAAAAAYPHVWWHLWSCVGCAEIVVQVAALAAAERAGDLPALPVTSTAPSHLRRVIGRLMVAPQALARIVETRALLGVAYGAEDLMVLDEGEDHDQSFQLHLQREAGGTWQVLVQVEPPINGVAVITIGDTSYQAPFDAYGIAEIRGVSDELLRASGTAISFSIESI